MEKSSISVNKGCSSGSRFMVDSSPEESGWTLYFEDFLYNNASTNENFQEKHSLILSTSSDYEITSPSLSIVSDAASSASAVGFSLKTSCRNLSFKQKRRSCIVHQRSYTVSDDTLEDTASSPVNSPKEDSASRSVYSTELKRRGLCLVPVSTRIRELNSGRE